MNKQKIQQMIDQRQEQRADIYRIERNDVNSFTINGHPYELLINYKDAFRADKLADRFSTILSKYDYIVGDWGFDQLRLKGFYAAQKPGIQAATVADAIQDYLYEYCNFGCAYFVIQNLDVQVAHSEHTKRRRSRKPVNHRGEVHAAKKGTASHNGDKVTNEKRGSRSPKKNGGHRRRREPQIHERTTKVNPVPIEKRPEQEVVRKSGAKKQQKFVIRHK